MRVISNIIFATLLFIFLGSMAIVVTVMSLVFAVGSSLTAILITAKDPELKFKNIHNVLFSVFKQSIEQIVLVWQQAIFHSYDALRGK